MKIIMALCLLATISCGYEPVQPETSLEKKTTLSDLMMYQSRCYKVQKGICQSLKYCYVEEPAEAYFLCKFTYDLDCSAVIYAEDVEDCLVDLEQIDCEKHQDIPDSCRWLFTR